MQKGSTLAKAVRDSPEVTTPRQRLHSHRWEGRALWIRLPQAAWMPWEPHVAHTSTVHSVLQTKQMPQQTTRFQTMLSACCRMATHLSNTTLLRRNSLQIFFVSYLILIKPYNCLHFSYLKNSIRFLTEWLVL